MDAVTAPRPAIVALLDGSTHAYQVRNGYEWGTIYVRPLKSVRDDSFGAEVTANSTYGVYGYTWTHMGCDWRAFLTSVDMHYAMNKMAGQRFHVPTDKDEWLAGQRAYLAERDAENSRYGWHSDETKALYKELGEALDEIEDQGDLFDCEGPTAFFREYDRITAGKAYGQELYSIANEKINPQVIGFWDKIWLPFVASLAPDADCPTEAAA